MTPLEQVKQIYEQSKMYSAEEGKKIAEILLEGRVLDDLNAEELEWLTRGYNWSRESEKGFYAIAVQVEKFPNQVNREFLDGIFRSYAWELADSIYLNRKRLYVIHVVEYGLEWDRIFALELIKLYEKFPQYMYGADFLTNKAGIYLDVAVPDGQYPYRIWEGFPLGKWDEWDLSKILVDRDFLDRAALCLEQAIQLDPNVKWTFSKNGKMWDFFFAPIFVFPEYRHLAQFRYTNEGQLEENPYHPV
jgi:hypothetical protein